MHWYVYHSQNTMGVPYSSFISPVAFSTNAQPKLCHGDTIWVIEGDTSTPINYTLSDRFVAYEIEFIPKRTGKFKIKINGEKSLLAHEIPLGKSLKWFKERHHKYISKQKLFCSLEGFEEAIEGLELIAGSK